MIQLTSRVLLLIFFLAAPYVQAQKHLDYVSLTTISPLEKTTDLETLDSLFSSKRLIGLGESTHASSEFTIMRHRLFKYLVEHHGYTVFFLEADFSACQRVNDYVHGKDDDALEALDEIKLWPWRTKEMLTLIEWIKQYNEIHDNILYFVGCDMQLIRDDRLTLKRLTLLSPLRHKVDAIFYQLGSKTPDSVVVQRLEKWNELKPMLVEKYHDRFTYRNLSSLTRTVDQWFDCQLNNKDNYNYRDSCMAANIHYYLRQNPQLKGVYFAHNWHVGKAVIENKKSYATKSAGRYLKEYFGTAYHPIALVGYNLRFNALTCQSGTLKMKTFNHICNQRKDLERYLLAQGSPLLFVSASAIKRLERYKMTEIGGLYEQSCSGYTPSSRKKVKASHYDSFIFIRSTSKTQLTETVWETYQ